MRAGPLVLDKDMSGRVQSLEMFWAYITVAIISDLEATL